MVLAVFDFSVKDAGYTLVLSLNECILPKCRSSK